MNDLVLCGQLLCFFKEQEDFLESKAAGSPLNLYQAVCEVIDSLISVTNSAIIISIYENNI